MATVTLHVPAMSSRGTVRAVTRRLRDLAGVRSVRADPSTRRVVVEGEITEPDVLAALADVRFAASGQTTDPG